MRYYARVLFGLLVLSIPFWFGFVFVPRVDCAEMEIMFSTRILAGISCEIFAALSTVLVVYGVIRAFDTMISEKMNEFYGERRIDPRR